MDADARFAQLEAQNAQLVARIDALSEMTMPLVLADLKAKMIGTPEVQGDAEQTPEPVELTAEERADADLRRAAGLDPRPVEELDQQLNRLVYPSGKGKPAPKRSGVLADLDAHLGGKYGLNPDAA
jgi:hypothetical protein